MPVADPRDEERVGSVLHGKWTLERLLGVGGMGAVYAAKHRNGARAAVKVLSPAASRQPHIRSRFLREGYAANRVEHPGAVRVLDDDVISDGPDEGTAYLVMELLEGESLQERAKRPPPLGERDLLQIADGVLSVLAAAHDNGVVHRDLKPDNLFLARSGEGEGVQIKVLDFGLARLLEANEQTIAGMALGTPTYMSPEQAAGHVEEIDGRTDIYALGAILFQLVSNKRIHDAAHTLGLVVRMATTPAPKLSTVAPDVSPAFARIVDKALEFKREDRYPDAAAMRADVQAALAELTLGQAATVHLSAPEAAEHPPDEAAASSLRAEQTKAVRDAAPSPPPPASTVERTSRPAIEHDRRPSRSRSWAGPLVVLGLVGLGGLAASRHWASMERDVIPVEGANASASSSVSPLEADADPEPLSLPAPTDPEVDAAVDDDASAAATMDLDELSDASVDGGDDEDDEDDEDEDDEIEDAGLDAAAAEVARGSTASPSRGTPQARRPKHGHTVKPQKPKRPRKPGHPRRKKRWRR